MGAIDTFAQYDHLDADGDMRRQAPHDFDSDEAEIADVLWRAIQQHAEPIDALQHALTAMWKSKHHTGKQISDMFFEVADQRRKLDHDLDYQKISDFEWDEGIRLLALNILLEVL